MQSTYLIIGAGVAGVTAALAIRDNDATGSIVLVGQESHPLYSRLRLTSVVRDSMTTSEVFLRNFDYYKKHAIDFVSGCPAVGLSIDEKVVTLADGRRCEYQKLLLAGGSQTRTWSVPGAQLDNILTMRDLDQAVAIKARLAESKHVVVVGGGFITLEYIEALADIGVATSVIIRDPYYWSNKLDEESGLLIQKHIDKIPNIDVYYDTEVMAIEGRSVAEAVVLSNGKRLPTDTIITNIGVDPATTWLTNSGLKVDGGVEVDEYLNTDQPEIWAAGDIALFYDQLLGVRHRIANWDNAAAQGELVGRNMSTDQPQPFITLSAYTIDCLGMNISFIGETHHHAGVVAVPRGSARSGAYGRLLLHDHRLVGATLINRFPDKQPIEQLIRHQAHLNQQHIIDLTDETVDLRHLASSLIKL